jgi:hypothetical protein
MKFEIGEYYEKLVSHFNIYIGWICLMTTLHENLLVFLRVLLHIRKKCISNSVQYHVSVNHTVFGIITQKLCYEYIFLNFHIQQSKTVIDKKKKQEVYWVQTALKSDLFYSVNVVLVTI